MIESSRLFIELYTDEDVDILVADLLRARGFDALTTRDAQHLHTTDEEQLALPSQSSEHSSLTIAPTSRRYTRTI